MKKAIAIQVIIFVVAWFVMTPDVAQDNTYIFGLFGSVEIVRGNTIWILLGAMVLSVINIWFWWSKKIRVDNPSETPIPSAGTKSAEAGEEVKVAEEAEDPIVPKMD